MKNLYAIIFAITIFLTIAGSSNVLADSCRNISFTIKNERNGDIEIKKVTYFNQDENRWQDEDVPNTEIKRGQSRKFGKEDLRDSEGDKITKIKFEFVDKNDGQSKVSQVFVPGIPRCSAERNYGTYSITGSSSVKESDGIFSSDSCKNVVFNYTNGRSGEIKVKSVKYFNRQSGNWKTEDVTNEVTRQGAKGVTNFDNLSDANGDDITKVIFIYEFKSNNSGANWSSSIESETFEPIDPKCFEGKVYGLGQVWTITADTNNSLEINSGCVWTVSGTVKVKSQQDLVVSKFGEQVPLKGIQVKVSGATIGWFDSWDTVFTDADGKFTVKKQKSCENRKLKIEVLFQNDDLELFYEHPLQDSVPISKWFTILEDSERSREPGKIQIVPTVFDSGKNFELNDTLARDHADLWIMANAVRNQMASYGPKFAFKNKSKIVYPYNMLLVSDNKEASFSNPITKVVHIFRSNDGKEDHLEAGTIQHEMMHTWAYENVSGELDLATNLIFTGSTHCSNTKEHISFHEAFAEFAMERLYEEIYGVKHTLPFNRDALKEGLMCEGRVDRITNMTQMEQHEYGWMSLFRMLTTKDLYWYNYGGEASSTDPNPFETHGSNSSVFVTKNSTAPLGCTGTTDFTLKSILKVFMPDANKGFSKNLTKSEMNINGFMNRSAKILNFEEQKSELKDLLDPTKTLEPKDLFCGKVNLTRQTLR